MSRAGTYQRIRRHRGEAYERRYPSAEVAAPTIFDTCQPREDILRGAVTDADFAADLASVVSGAGSPAYADPARFFANTYPRAGCGICSPTSAAA